MRYHAKERIRRFRYPRENLLMVRVHLALKLQAIFLWPRLLLRRFTGAAPFDATLYRG